MKLLIKYNKYYDEKYNLLYSAKYNTYISNILLKMISMFKLKIECLT
jgi:hypothetical protein